MREGGTLKNTLKGTYVGGIHRTSFPSALLRARKLSPDCVNPKRPQDARMFCTWWSAIRLPRRVVQLRELAGHTDDPGDLGRVMQIQVEGLGFRVGFIFGGS